MYHFGSQTEGTSTPEMGSDLDTLQYGDFENVFLNTKNWVPGKFNMRLCILPDTPPRHCSLQMYEPEDPVPAWEVDVPFMILDEADRLLVQNNMFDHVGREVHTEGCKTLIKHGPSMSNTQEKDYVMAELCKEIPVQCKAWLHRPHPAGWPSPQLLSQTQQHGIFLLPVGHPESENSSEEWRFSPSLMERQLMFSLNIIQLKVYILLKLVKNTLFKPIVSDHLTSFHCKTILLFTIENTPQSIWTEHNLLLGFLLALNSLRRFLMCAYCPHYIVQNNLFIGKLPFHEFGKVLKVVQGIIHDPIESILTIKYESLGVRMLSFDMKSFPISLHASTKHHHRNTKQTVLFHLVFRVLATYGSMMNRACNSSDSYQLVSQHVQYYEQLIQDGSPYEQIVAKIMYSKCCNVMASLQTTRCTTSSVHLSVPNTALHLYNLSLEAGLAEMLKFASMLYCRGEMERAADCLDTIETLYTDHVYVVCECRHSERRGVKPLSEDILELPEQVFMSKYIAGCVQFVPIESPLVPDHLCYEMCRSTPEDKTLRHCEAGRHDEWMDQVCVDCQPFLYYLQYITHRHLHNGQRVNTAFSKLQEYVQTAQVDHGHYETALNLLGHCYELQGDQTNAREIYKLSLQVLPQNNAANWHIMRLDSPNLLNAFLGRTQNTSMLQLIQTIQANPGVINAMFTLFGHQEALFKLLKADQIKHFKKTI